MTLDLEGASSGSPGRELEVKGKRGNRVQVARSMVCRGRMGEEVGDILLEDAKCHPKD